MQFDLQERSSVLWWLIALRTSLALSLTLQRAVGEVLIDKLLI